VRAPIRGPDSEIVSCPGFLWDDRGRDFLDTAGWHYQEGVDGGTHSGLVAKNPLEGRWDLFPGETVDALHLHHVPVVLCQAQVLLGHGS
jgi:hypothetical protein